jgi:hypothetical protein
VHARSSKVRWGRVLLLGSLAAVLVVAAVVGTVYARTEIPEPNAEATAATVRILYEDGSEIGRVGAQNRIPVSLDQVPEHVQLAVLAAEDRGFYTEPGISPRGIARALLTNVRGGGVQQGGSTITQQYAKNAFLTAERTYSRKVKEVFIALKMSRQLEKDQILEDYLNTIYWGRQASGIGVAARTYFGTDDVSTLTVAQGAVLAASIRSPGNYDPTEDPERAQARWEYVLDGMVEQGWLTQEERAAQVYPAVLAPGQGVRNNDLTGPKGHVIRQVQSELAARGFDEQRLSDGGLVVRTTIRKAAQEAAVAPCRTSPARRRGGRPAGALVSIEPSTGAVVAYYGGATGTGFDFANNTGTGRQPGSTFKPFVLAHRAVAGHEPAHPPRRQRREGVPGHPPPHRELRRRLWGRVDLVGGHPAVGQHGLLPARPRGRPRRGRRDRARGRASPTTHRSATPTARSRAASRSALRGAGHGPGGRLRDLREPGGAGPALLRPRGPARRRAAVPGRGREGPAGASARTSRRTPPGPCRRSCSAAPAAPPSSTAGGTPPARPARAPTTRTPGSSASPRSCPPPCGSGYADPARSRSTVSR